MLWKSLNCYISPISHLPYNHMLCAMCIIICGCVAKKGFQIRNPNKITTKKNIGYEGKLSSLLLLLLNKQSSHSQHYFSWDDNEWNNKRKDLNFEKVCDAECKLYVTTNGRIKLWKKFVAIVLWQLNDWCEWKTVLIKNLTFVGRLFNFNLACLG